MPFVFLYNYLVIMAIGYLAVLILRKEDTQGAKSDWKGEGFLLVGFPLLLGLREVGISGAGLPFWNRLQPGLKSIDLLLLAIWLVFGLFRGLCEWWLLARDAYLDWKGSMPGELLQNAPPVNYLDLCRTAKLRRAPQIRILPGLVCPKVAIWEGSPYILFPAAQVPIELRNESFFWDGVEDESPGWGKIREDLAHELRHIKAGDHWRHQIRSLTSGLTFWEWGVEGGRLGKFASTPWVIAMLDFSSRLTAWVGAPFRKAVGLDWEIQEALAREDPPKSGQTWHFPAKRVGLLLLMSCALVFAPGRDDLKPLLFKGSPLHQDLPTGWSFLVPVGSSQAKAFSFHTPAGRRVVVDVDAVEGGRYNSWPRLNTAGLLGSPLPAMSRVRVDWMLAFDGRGSLPPMVRIWLTTNFDPRNGLDHIEIPGFAIPMAVGDGKFMVTQILDLPGHGPNQFQRMEFSMAFRRPGRYTISAPVVTVEDASRNRRQTL